MFKGQTGFVIKPYKGYIHPLSKGWIVSVTWTWPFKSFTEFRSTCRSIDVSDPKVRVTFPYMSYLHEDVHCYYVTSKWKS